jgi:N-acetylglucosaminyl-diphospho-decaprenol L-rhamnosyltransferase
MSYYDITVVITTFRSEKKIIPCLNSINDKIKIIIIENSNNSNFKHDIESKYSNITCILAEENLGYAKGNNLGLSKVQTKYALIINPDAVLDERAVDNFLKTANEYSDFAIISPLVQEDKDLKDNIDITKPIETNNVKGFGMFLNMIQFEKIGFFDDNFFIYFEEIDLCRRLRDKKKKIYLDPSIKLYHKGGSSHDESINLEMELSRNWHWMWSSFYYHKKYYGYFFAILKVLPKLNSSFLKMIFYSILFKKNKSMIYAHRFYGLINSICGKKSSYRPKA